MSSDRLRTPSIHQSRRQFIGKGLFAGALAGITLPRGLDAASPAGAAVGPAPGHAVQQPASGSWGKAEGVETLFNELKKPGNEAALYRFLYAFPKGGDIHHHLGGGIFASTFYAIATDPKRTGGQRFFTRYRISSREPLPFARDLDSRSVLFWITLSEQAYKELPSSLQGDFKPLDALAPDEQDEWMRSLYLDHPGEGRNEFFEYIWSRLNHLLSSINVMTAVLLENMKLFGAEGVRYLEIQTGMFGWRDADNQLLSVDEATAVWQEMLASPEARATGVTVRFQHLVVRFLPSAVEQVEAAFGALDRHRDLWVGINMAGREDDNRGYPRRFTEVYDRMLGKYPRIDISIHAGEAEKKDSNIFDTLRLGASRIGHAINLIQDEPTMLLLRNGSVLLEINLISNELLGYVPDLDRHPFPIYFRQGIPCCLNTDDRGMWHSNLTDEFYTAVTRFNLSWSEIQELARNSLERSFAQPDLKTFLVDSWREDLQAFTRTFGAGNPSAALSRVPAVTHNYGKEHFSFTS